MSITRVVRYGDAADALSRVLGQQIRYVPRSDEEAKTGMLSAGMPAFCADHLLDLFRVYRSGAAAGEETRGLGCRNRERHRTQYRPL
ncbi:MAG: hypothetical protein ACREXS_02460 [Gammaproteobacteria bacterium]